MTALIPNFVSGSTTHNPATPKLDVNNPANDDVVGYIHLSSQAEVDAAVASAKAAFPGWRDTPPLKRARVMFRFNELLNQNAEEIAQALTREHGKTLDDAMGEVTRGIEVVEFAAGIPHLLKGTYTEQVASSVDAWSYPQPLGVVAGITPFNFPAMVPMWMFPIALACGNSFILKPSEKDPSASLILARLLQEAGLPDGVFNVVQGSQDAVNALLDHSDVKAISFVGSTPVAQYIYSRGTANGKRVQALGGAKNHMLVLPDADLDQAADAIMGAAYGSAGERCMAISVAVPIGQKTADALMERLIPRVKALRVGLGTEPGMEMGPLITREQRDRVASLVQSGQDEGAKILVDGRGIQVPGGENGYFIGGCLLDHVQPHMQVYKEEVFGPVLCTVRVEDYEAALDLVHSNPYGNGVAIFTRDGDAARDFVSRIEVGMVGVNVPIPVPVAYHSFGGWKQSLFGDHHIYGPDGVRFYTRTKAVTSRWPQGIKSGAVFSFPTMN
ncbi:MAG: CoA-acylating methylmalonate-semialdehyde dehydrogenase [bacterium]|jgi:malonate-semialdehyde dehydrogenase (acetylating)/methylmalonate-semialdehyde dehydrogenase